MYVVKQGGRVDYNYKEIYLDTEAELKDVKVDSLCPGSTVYVLDTAVVYILNSKKE